MMALAEMEQHDHQRRKGRARPPVRRSFDVLPVFGHVLSVPARDPSRGAAFCHGTDCRGNRVA